MQGCHRQVKKVRTCLFFQHSLGRLCLCCFCNYSTPRLSHQIVFKLQMNRQENTVFIGTLGLKILFSFYLNENCDFRVIVNLLRARHFIFNLKRFDGQVDTVDKTMVYQG